MIIVRTYGFNETSGEGNYWDDWMDNPGYPDYYVIPGGDNQDNYPLMMPYGEIPPIITNITFTASDPLDMDIGWEYISCIVTDDTAVDEVKFVLVGDTTAKYPMVKIGDDYHCNITIETADEYTYHIWVNDTSRNANISISQPFNLPMNEDVDESGKVHFMDLVAVSLKYNQVGPPGWIREDVNNDGKVHFMDLVAISLAYNEEW